MIVHRRRNFADRRITAASEPVHQFEPIAVRHRLAEAHVHRREPAGLDQVAQGVGMQWPLMRQVADIGFENAIQQAALIVSSTSGAPGFIL